MSVPTDIDVSAADQATPSSAVRVPDRRGDVDAKQTLIAGLLRQVGCDGLLVQEPENLAWLTSGAALHGILNPADRPCLYFSADQRWLIACSVDSPRLFDEEVYELGFQLKEWPWYRSREQLLGDICQERKVASDRAFAGILVVEEQLRQLRRAMMPYEVACYRALGLILGHALEATCRHLVQDQTEREVVGQVCHRLLNRGAEPISVTVGADGRLERYRRGSFSNEPVRQSCFVLATARKYGLVATASRGVTFGPPDEQIQQEYDASCKISANFIACSWPDAVPREVVNIGRRVYRVSGYEHDWLYFPPGHITGRSPVELPIGLQTDDLFRPGWVITWYGSVGTTCSCDTILVTADGPKLITPTENWPLKRVRVQGANLVRPDLLQR